MRFVVMDEGVGEQLIEQLARHALYGSRVGMVERVLPDGPRMVTMYEIELPREKPTAPAKQRAGLSY
jgi:hypothetical protein